MLFAIFLNVCIGMNVEEFNNLLNSEINIESEKLERINMGKFKDLLISTICGATPLNSECCEAINVEEHEITGNIPTQIFLYLKTAIDNITDRLMKRFNIKKEEVCSDLCTSEVNISREITVSTDGVKEAGVDLEVVDVEEAGVDLEVVGVKEVVDLEVVDLEVVDLEVVDLEVVD
ncbi:hypothetical protein NGRA_0905, partial [Nosema granulosis]